MDIAIIVIGLGVVMLVLGMSIADYLDDKSL
jgi:hypothetical protein